MSGDSNSEDNGDSKYILFCICKRHEEAICCQCQVQCAIWLDWQWIFMIIIQKVLDFIPIPDSSMEPQRLEKFVGCKCIFFIAFPQWMNKVMISVIKSSKIVYELLFCSLFVATGKWVSVSGMHVEIAKRLENKIAPRVCSSSQLPA